MTIWKIARLNITDELLLTKSYMLNTFLRKTDTDLLISLKLKTIYIMRELFTISSYLSKNTIKNSIISYIDYRVNILNTPSKKPYGHISKHYYTFFLKYLVRKLYLIFYYNFYIFIISSSNVKKSSILAQYDYFIYYKNQNMYS